MSQKRTVQLCDKIVTSCGRCWRQSVQRLAPPRSPASCSRPTMASPMSRSRRNQMSTPCTATRARWREQLKLDGELYLRAHLP